MNQYEEQIEKLMKMDRTLTHQELMLLDYCNYIVRSGILDDYLSARYESPNE